MRLVLQSRGVVTAKTEKLTLSAEQIKATEINASLSKVVSARVDTCVMALSCLLTVSVVSPNMMTMIMSASACFSYADGTTAVTAEQGAIEMQHGS